MKVNYTNSFFSKVHRRTSLALETLFSNNYSIYPQQSYAYHNLSFAQEGEDLVLKRIFESQQKGFYIDVGAHHPQRFSNTYLFYLKGWRGLNIDAMPGSMKSFEELRKEDINIEAAISDSSEILEYYIFDEPALNGFSRQLSANRDENSNFKIVDKKLIQTHKLSEILDRHLPPRQEIDFLSIDVEGLDYQVLLSNNWSKYRPKVILFEELSTSLEDISGRSATLSLLRDLGYELFAKTVNTSFYKLATA